MVFIRLFTLLAVLLFVPEVYGQKDLFKGLGEYRKYGEEKWHHAKITLDDRGKVTIRSVLTNEVITVTVSNQSKTKAFFKELGVRLGQALVGLSTLYGAYGVRESWSEREFQYFEISTGVVGNVIGLYLMGLKPDSQKDLEEQATNMFNIPFGIFVGEHNSSGNGSAIPDSIFVPFEIRFSDDEDLRELKKQFKKLKYMSTSSKPPNRMHFGLAPMRDGIKAGLSYTF